MINAAPTHSTEYRTRQFPYYEQPLQTLLVDLIITNKKKFSTGALLSLYELHDLVKGKNHKSQTFHHISPKLSHFQSRIALADACGDSPAPHKPTSSSPHFHTLTTPRCSYNQTSSTSIIPQLSVLNCARVDHIYILILTTQYYQQVLGLDITMAYSNAAVNVRQ